LLHAAIKKNQETIDYYLSQSRDPDLVGWWKWNLEDEFAFYWHFKETGTIADLQHMGGETEHYSEFRYYWYTEKKNGRNILYSFHHYGGLKGSDYSRDYYEIRNDSLWMSSGIEGDKFFHELVFFGVRTTAPEGYENR
jgi:hypothetical protein